MVLSVFFNAVLSSESYLTYHQLQKLIDSSRSSSLPYRAQRVLSYSMSAAARAFQGNSDKTDRVVGAVIWFFVLVCGINIIFKLFSFFLLFNSKLHRRLHVITPSLWRLISYLFLS